MQSQRLTTRAAAGHIGVSVSLLSKFRMTGGGPDFLKLGKKVLYDTAALDRWLASRVRKSTAQNSHAA